MKNLAQGVCLAMLATFAQQGSVFAQSVDSVTTSANDIATNGNVTANAQSAQSGALSRVTVSYLGVLNGPGFSGELDGKTKDGDPIYMHNRPTIKYKISDNILFGVQPRFNVRFLGDGMDVVMDNTRVQTEFKNVLKSGMWALSLTPRLSMPTKPKSHDQRMAPSPELLAKVDLTPKDSRFTFDSWYIFGNYLYSDTARSLSATQIDSVLAMEAAYQLGPTTGLTFGYYMEHASTNQAALTSASNEIDLGVNWDFAKGWSVNPVVATELNGLGANGASFSKNMGLYVWVSGAVL